MTFSGLMSRCTMPAACATESARASCAPIRASAGTSSGLPIIAASDGPSTSSIAMKRRSQQIADLVDRHDVRMIQRRGGAGFLLESPDRVGIARERGLQQLHRDVAAKPGVVRQVDFPHSAAADERQHVVGADASADRLGLVLIAPATPRPAVAGGPSTKSPAWSCARSSDSTSWRRSASASQAPLRNCRPALARQLQRGVKQLPDSARTVRASSAAAQFAKEPGLRQAPVASHRADRHVEHVRRLLEAQPAEEAQLDDAGSAARSASRATSARHRGR